MSIDPSSAGNVASSLLRSSYAGGRYQLIIDGAQTSAFIKSVEGGLVKTANISEPTGSHNEQIKHNSTLEIEPISLEVGVASMLDMLGWLKDSWNKKASTRNGAVVFADFNGKSQLELWFYRALLQEITFPSLDATSKDGVFVKVKMLPDQIELRQSAGVPVFGAVDPLQKMLSSCAFQVEIDGVECSKVHKVEGLAFKQGVKDSKTGKHRWPVNVPTKVEYSDFSITMPVAHAASMIQWYTESVIKGVRDDKMQRTGSIVFLSANRALPLFRISLAGLGIKGASFTKSDAGGDSIKRIKFDLYVSKMGLEQTPSRDPMAYTGRAT